MMVQLWPTIESLGGALTPRGMTWKVRTPMRPNRSTPTCSVEDCDRPHKARGLCDMHYHRWRRHGASHVGAFVPRGTCSIDGCDDSSRARGLCKNHYDRWLRGSKDDSAKITPEVEARFWSRVVKTSNCWEWTAANNGAGYGMIAVSGRNRLAHRLSYELHVGDIPDGLVVCHHCDNRKCVRPDHLFVGSVADNARDAARKGRIFFPGARLTEDQVYDIRVRYANGQSTIEQLSSEFGLRSVSIKHIVLGKSWRRVPMPVPNKREALGQ